MNCDGTGPHSTGTRRLLPTGADGKALLCRACFEREMQFRRAANAERTAYTSAHDVPQWETLRPDPRTDN